MSLPAVVRVELTPETRRLLLRLIEAVEKLGRSQSPTVHHTFAEEPPNDEGLTSRTNPYLPPDYRVKVLRRCTRCRTVLSSGEDELCADCEQGVETGASSVFAEGGPPYCSEPLDKSVRPFLCERPAHHDGPHGIPRWNVENLPEPPNDEGLTPGGWAKSPT